MRNRIRDSLGVLALALSFVAAVNAKTPAARERPNILLILSDDHSVPHAGCYGNANIKALSITPNLDAFATQGVCFDRAYTTAPQCAPSRASIFAGRNPVDLGVTRFGQPVRREIPFFSDILRASGYWVGLEGRNHHLGGRSGDPPHVVRALAESGLSRMQDRFDHVNVYNTQKIDPSEIGDRVGAALDRVPEGRPFFLYFGFNQTHRDFVSRHSDIDAGRLELPPDWPDLPEVRADYADFLSDLRQLDRGFGDIMRELEARGIADNTIVVFMGDNGESMYRGKGTLYERGNRVPLIVRWPGVAKPGTHSGALVSGVDLATTFLEAASLKPDPLMSGISLTPLLRGEASNGRRFVFTERGYHPGPLTLSEGVDYGRAVSGVRYKLIYNAQPAQPYSPVDQGGRYLSSDLEAVGAGAVLPAEWRSDEDRATPSWRPVVRAHEAGRLPQHIERIYFERPRPVFELYDLQADPFELVNLSARRELQAVETELREQLDLWMVANSDYLPLPSQAYQETPDGRRPRKVD